MVKILDFVNEVLWGVPTMILILLVGILLSIRSRFAQFRLFPMAVRKFIGSFRNKGQSDGGMSGYRALCTALAATVGTGNIAGVAGAIAIGGPGVVFWMWVSALLGMITKMAEVTLAIIYRRKNTAGEYAGGTMHMITMGLDKKYHFLAYVYAFFGVVASFGVGNATQVNAVMNGIKSIASSFQLSFGLKQTLFLGIIIAILITLAFRNGVNTVGNWAEKLIPAASALYILLAIGVLVMRYWAIPDAFAAIISGAFHPRSVTCGMISSMLLTLRVGMSRGVFTNEAGMGTAAIAHASAASVTPAQQGLMGMIEVFLDTVVICTLTALVILCSDISIAFGTDPGIKLTLDAFSSVYGNWCRIALTVLSCVFAFATILGWGLYGARCAQFLFGDRVWSCFVLVQALAVIIGAVMNTAVVWVIAEILNALMALPNLFAILLLMPRFTTEIEWFQGSKKLHSS